jgi:hypothetical protein
MKTKLKTYNIELDFVDYSQKSHIENLYALKNPTYPQLTKCTMSTSVLRHMQERGKVLCSKKGLEQLMRHRMLVCLKGV